MKLALISFAKEDVETRVPIGLLPLFNGTVAQAQVQAVCAAGAEKIIFLSPTMSGALLQYIDRLKQEGISAEIVRSAQDLAQYASDNDDLLYLEDGILPGKDLIDALGVGQGETIFVASNADQYSHFERIDLNHRWLGIAKLKASRLSALLDLPDDWDIGSALLRTAVQAECNRTIILDSDIDNGRIQTLFSNVQIAQYTRSELNNSGSLQENFLEKWIAWPLTRRLLPKLWRRENSARNIGISSMVCGAIATVLAYFSWSVASLGFLVAGSLLAYVGGRIPIFARRPNGERVQNIAFAILTLIALIILVFVESGPRLLLPNLVILAIFVGNLATAIRGRSSGRLAMLKPSILLVIMIFLAGASFGSFVSGLYVAALFCAAFLVAHLGLSRDNDGDVQNSAK
ncbi:hypothetical protein [Parasphingorhabdus halotolerans]|uniref:Uncharacterized protein n=1 Tax=Parasphingorhabdus halotolerans TaxID=2725558 RepID=A0A6H2DKB0_9SPHN|nr:hypothetical protein [Parasphingorhabdus halotolerans]QJB68096.1 hypothetical protein HF685_01220 [Parasphingorhabdus halotolerans]